MNEVNMFDSKVDIKPQFLYCEKKNIFYQRKGDMCILIKHSAIALLHAGRDLQNYLKIFNNIFHK